MHENLETERSQQLVILILGDLSFFAASSKGDDDWRRERDNILEKQWSQKNVLKGEKSKMKKVVEEEILGERFEGMKLESNTSGNWDKKTLVLLNEKLFSSFCTYMKLGLTLMQTENTTKKLKHLSEVKTLLKS